VTIPCAAEHVPCLTAADSSRPDPGNLLIGWIAVEALLLEDSSFLEPLYATLGAATVAAGCRWLRDALHLDGHHRTRR
jgi:hypothetical protein